MRIALALVVSTFAALASAQTTPAPSTTPAPQRARTHWPVKDELYIAQDFKFGTGETLPELKLRYLTLGSPHRNAAGHVDNAVLVLHGTGGNRFTLLAPAFSDVLFGPGQPLDTAKYFLIFPDDIGQGDSSKPSDGLKMNFPHYDYDDMVRSQHQMLLEGLHVDHLRLIIGTSMGCMQSFVWGETYPDFMDALMPLACQPTEIAGRNRMWRYMAIENIEHDPAWDNGNYSTEPIEGLRSAAEMSLLVGTTPLLAQKAGPTRVAAEKYVDDYLDRVVPHLDANNFIYYFQASRNYNPEPKLDQIKVPVMFVNSADDFINPPDLDFPAKLIKKVPRGQFVLIPTSSETRGHGTHTQAHIWKNYLIQLLAESEPKQ